MSFDLKMSQICPHLIVDEVIDLSTDLQTLVPLHPIASTSMQVMENGITISGYYLSRDSDESDRVIRFGDRKRSNDNIYEITYYTSSEYCPRCNGSRLEFDWRYTDTGVPVQVTGIDKLVQDIRKILLTELGSNRFHLWYGTQIMSSIGSKLSNSGILSSILSSEIETCLKGYMSLQRQQSLAQEVPASERLAKVISIQVLPVPEEPTALYIEVKVLSQSRETSTFVLEDPLSGNSYRLES